LPRTRWDESTWIAAGGAVGALPSAANAIIAGLNRSPFSLEIFEIVQLFIFVVFLVWFLARRSKKSEKTSRDLLEEFLPKNLPAAEDS
jgi:hypothetical protein